MMFGAVLELGMLHGAAMEAAAGAQAQAARSRPGAAAALRVEGRTFTATSGQRQLNAGVQKLVDEVGVPSAFHGKCAEINCISAAMDAGVDPTGA